MKLGAPINSLAHSREAALPPHSAERLRLSVWLEVILRGCASNRLRRSLTPKRLRCGRKGGAFPHCAAAEPRTTEPPSKSGPVNAIQ